MGLGKLADAGDTAVLSALADCIKNDSAPTVRRRALMSFGELCSHDHSAVITVAAGCLEIHEDYRVHCTALDLLGRHFGHQRSGVAKWLSDTTIANYRPT